MLAAIAIAFVIMMYVDDREERRSAS